MEDENLCAMNEAVKVLTPGQGIHSKKPRLISRGRGDHAGESNAVFLLSVCLFRCEFDGNCDWQCGWTRVKFVNDAVESIIKVNRERLLNNAMVLMNPSAFDSDAAVSLVSRQRERDEKRERDPEKSFRLNVRPNENLPRASDNRADLRARVEQFHTVALSSPRRIPLTCRPRESSRRRLRG